VREISIAMITIDRAPRENYLPRTIQNLTRGGVFESPHFQSMCIADSGTSPDWPDRGLNDISWFAVKGDPDPAFTAPIQKPGRRTGASRSGSGEREAVKPFQERRSPLLAPPPALFAPLHAPPGALVSVLRSPAPRPAPLNAAAAMDVAVATGAPWILFMEDDIDVCGDFLESAYRWLKLYGTPEYRVFSFGANYPHVKVAAERLEFTWQYPVDWFYGSQCIALRRGDAASLAAYWRTNPEVPGATDTAIDIMVAQWHKMEYPAQPFFLATAPSFIQHIGRASYATTKEVTHQFTTWPGPFWVYEPGVVRV